MKQSSENQETSAASLEKRIFLNIYIHTHIHIYVYISNKYIYLSVVIAICIYLEKNFLCSRLHQKVLITRDTELTSRVLLHFVLIW